MKQVVEWAAFEIREGVSESAVVEASEALQRDFLSQQRGFVRRELLRGPARRWVDLVYWDSRESAENAVKNAGANPACHVYFGLMVSADHADPAAGVLHLEKVRTYGAGA